MVTITPITPNDHPEWLTLWNGYLEFYRINLDAEISATTFDRIVHSELGIHGALARNDNGEAVGLVHWLTHPATWTVTNYCYLEDLFVSVNARGTGIGKALIEHVRAWAEDNHSSKVYWLTEETNTTARALYDRVATRTGFIQYQVRIGG
jgi:GNAT superfamily N-acetyltransferase